VAGREGIRFGLSFLLVCGAISGYPPGDTLLSKVFDSFGLSLDFGSDHSPPTSRRFSPYFNDTRFDREICQMDESAKGASLLGFVRLDKAGGLTRDFWEENGKRKSRSPIDFAQGRLCGMTKKLGQRTVFICVFRTINFT
jgi:hypothetical protein